MSSHNNNAHICLNTELRHIPPSKIGKLSAIIDNSRDYDRLLEELARPESRLLLDGKSIVSIKLSVAVNLIKDQVHCGKSPTMALLNHWAITGRRRPTVLTLLAFLKLCNMKRAENYVLQDILGLEPEQQNTELIQIRQQKPVPAIQFLPDHTVEIEETYRFYDLNNLVEKLSPRCDRYSFDLIYESTNKFCHQPHDFRTKTGAKIGEGRFSSVYRASTRLLTSNDDQSEDASQVVAAKLLKSECNKTYIVNEINLTVKVDHENVLKFLGISLGESHVDKQLAYICLIYPYMENGSLLECLATGLPSRELRFLDWPERVMISMKVARGISYLHTFKEGPIIHRDIKTANILLDCNLEPKLGDFTIVRQIENTTMQTQYSQNIIGTSVYMPPEAFRGDISVKFDSFSFGIVLLELLTGMRTFDEEKNEDLLTYISDRLAELEDDFSSSKLDMNLPESGIGLADTTASSFERAKEEFIAEILDKKAGIVERPRECRTIFELAMRATESRKNSRPNIGEILSHLELLVAHASA